MYTYIYIYADLVAVSVVLEKNNMHLYLIRRFS
jgi:hypothetical protein